MSTENFELPTTDGMTEPPDEKQTNFSDPPKEEDVISAPTPEENKEVKKGETQRALTIPIGPDGKVMARDNAELIRLCGALILGMGVPKRFDNPTKLFAAIQFVRDLKLPDTAIRQVAPIEGTMSIFGDLPLALVQARGELTHFKEQWFDKEYKVISFENKNLGSEAWGAVCFVARNEEEIQSFSFTLDDAIKMGKYPAMKWEWVDNKKTGKKIQDNSAPWMAHTRLMLRYKARAIALKSIFADAVNGVSIAEHDFDEIDPAITRDVSPRSKSTLNEKLAADVSENTTA